MTHHHHSHSKRAKLKKNAPLLLGALFLIGTGMALTAKTDIPAPEVQAAAPVFAVDHFAGLMIEAKAGIIIDMKTGTVLYEKNADVQLPLASITKVPLVLAAAEVLEPERVITIPYYAGGTGESGHLTKGEEWRVREIVDFTLVSSSNNGAGILADAADSALRELYPEAPAGSATLWRMNDLAQDLNLKSTTFLNVSGLDLSTTQAGALGSARDVATLMAYAASSQPSLFAATARDHVLLTAVRGSAQNALNTNDAQGAIAGLIMGKTGFTDLAGGNLAVVFDVGLARPVVAVVLGSSEDGRFTDMQKLVLAAQKTITEAE